MKKPSHIAIIMDGNGRWAKEKGLPRKAGHKKGVQTLKKIVEECASQGINCLTVYAFSTENWNRPEFEINFIMELFRRTLHKEAKKLNKKKIRVKIIGRRSGIPASVLREIEYIENLTAENKDFFLNIAFNYGGRAEIVDAVKKIIRQGNSDPEKIDQDYLGKFLYNPQLSEVDLLIRTGGEKRISNFLLWQIAYAEIYVTETYWPDFDKNDLIKALQDFTKRERRFGSLDNNRMGD